MKVKIILFQTKLHHYENVTVNHLKFKYAVTGVTLGQQRHSGSSRDLC